MDYMGTYAIITIDLITSSVLDEEMKLDNFQIGFVEFHLMTQVTS